MRDVEISREKRLQAAPIETHWPRALRIIPADFGAGAFDRQGANAIVLSRDDLDQIEVKKSVFGGEVDSRRRAWIGGDVDSFDRDGPEQWRADFAKLDFELLSTRLPAQPEAKAVRNDKRRERNCPQRRNQRGKQDQQQAFFTH